jgi:hypothetical protein
LQCIKCPVVTNRAERISSTPANLPVLVIHLPDQGFNGTGVTVLPRCPDRIDPDPSYIVFKHPDQRLSFWCPDKRESKGIPPLDITVIMVEYGDERPDCRLPDFREGRGGMPVYIHVRL